MLIRPTRDEDTDAVITLWRQCGLLRPWNDPNVDIRLARETESAEIFVGIRENDFIAAAIMCGHDGHRGWLYYLAVAPEHRRQGLGGMIVTHAEQWLRGLGVPKLELMIRQENAAVTQFYGSMGYKTEPVITLSRWLRQPAEFPDV